MPSTSSDGTASSVSSPGAGKSVANEPIPIAKGPVGNDAPAPVPEKYHQSGVPTHVPLPAADGPVGNNAPAPVPDKYQQSGVSSHVPSPAPFGPVGNDAPAPVPMPKANAKKHGSMSSKTTTYPSSFTSTHSLASTHTQGTHTTVRSSKPSASEKTSKKTSSGSKDKPSTSVKTSEKSSPGSGSGPGSSSGKDATHTHNSKASDDDRVADKEFAEQYFAPTYVVPPKTNPHELPTRPTARYHPVTAIYGTRARTATTNPSYTLPSSRCNSQAATIRRSCIKSSKNSRSATQSGRYYSNQDARPTSAKRSYTLTTSQKHSRARTPTSKRSCTPSQKQLDMEAACRSSYQSRAGIRPQSKHTPTVSPPGERSGAGASAPISQHYHQHSDTHVHFVPNKSGTTTTSSGRYRPPLHRYVPQSGRATKRNAPSPQYHEYQQQRQPSRYSEERQRQYSRHSNERQRQSPCCSNLRQSTCHSKDQQQKCKCQCRTPTAPAPNPCCMDPCYPTYAFNDYYPIDEQREIPTLENPPKYKENIEYLQENIFNMEEYQERLKETRMLLFGDLIQYPESPPPPPPPPPPPECHCKEIWEEKDKERVTNCNCGMDKCGCECCGCDLKLKPKPPTIVDREEIEEQIQKKKSEKDVKKHESHHSHHHNVHHNSHHDHHHGQNHGHKPDHHHSHHDHHHEAKAQVVGITEVEMPALPPSAPFVEHTKEVTCSLDLNNNLVLEEEKKVESADKMIKERKKIQFQLAPNGGGMMATKIERTCYMAKVTKGKVKPATNAQNKGAQQVGSTHSRNHLHIHTGNSQQKQTGGPPRPAPASRKKAAPRRRPNSSGSSRKSSRGRKRPRSRSRSGSRCRRRCKSRGPCCPNQPQSGCCCPEETTESSSSSEDDDCCQFPSQFLWFILTMNSTAQYYKSQVAYQHYYQQQLQDQPAMDDGCTTGAESEAEAHVQSPRSSMDSNSSGSRQQPAVEKIDISRLEDIIRRRGEEGLENKEVAITLKPFNPDNADRIPENPLIDLKALRMFAHGEKEQAECCCDKNACSGNSCSIGGGGRGCCGGKKGDKNDGCCPIKPPSPPRCAPGCVGNENSCNGALVPANQQQHQSQYPQRPTFCLPNGANFGAPTCQVPFAPQPQPQYCYPPPAPSCYPCYPPPPPPVAYPPPQPYIYPPPAVPYCGMPCMAPPMVPMPCYPGCPFPMGGMMGMGGMYGGEGWDDEEYWDEDDTCQEDYGGGGEQSGKRGSGSSGGSRQKRVSYGSAGSGGQKRGSGSSGGSRNANKTVKSNYGGKANNKTYGPSQKTSNINIKFVRGPGKPK